MKKTKKTLSLLLAIGLMSLNSNIIAKSKTQEKKDDNNCIINEKAEIECYDKDNHPIDPYEHNNGKI